MVMAAATQAPEEAVPNLTVPLLRALAAEMDDVARLVADGVVEAHPIVSPTKEAKLKWLTGLLGSARAVAGGRELSRFHPTCPVLGSMFELSVTGKSLRLAEMAAHLSSMLCGALTGTYIDDLFAADDADAAGHARAGSLPRRGRARATTSSRVSSIGAAPVARGDQGGDGGGRRVPLARRRLCRCRRWWAAKVARNDPDNARKAVRWARAPSAAWSAAFAPASRIFSLSLWSPRGHRRRAGRHRGSNPGAVEGSPAATPAASRAASWRRRRRRGDRAWYGALRRDKLPAPHSQDFHGIKSALRTWHADATALTQPKLAPDDRKVQPRWLVAEYAFRLWRGSQAAITAAGPG